jgi:AAA domain-containing protein
MSSIGKLPSLFRMNELKASFGTVLSYGPAGAGKTRSIETLEKHGMAPLVLVTELGETGGCLSVASSNICGLKITSHPMLIDVIRALKRKAGKVEYEQTEFGSVVLDSVTQWGEYPLERYMQLKGWEDLHGANEKGGGKDPRTAYGFLAEKGRQLYKELFELHAHLYIIAREGLFGGGDEALFAAPELPGQKLPRELPGWPDATVRLRVVAGKHMMITKGEGGSPARVRLPQSVAPLPLRCLPDIGALIKYMCGDASAFKFLVPEDEKATQGKVPVTKTPTAPPSV